MKMNSVDSHRYHELVEKLEIVIITYNRVSYLKRTLEQLKDSPFIECRITVLDNCSTDDTTSMVNRISSFFPQLFLIKNKINIGGNANIIRAIEISKGVYTWVLCDDDNFDYSYCDDVIEAIINESHDLIHIGAHEEYWGCAGLSINIKDLLNQGYPFFKYCSFLPCNIFRTELFYKTIVLAYDNICNWYPHMPFLIDMYNKNEKIYISKNKIVTSVIGNQPYSFDILIHKWMNFAPYLKSKKEKLLFVLNQYSVSSEKEVISLNKLLLLYSLYILRKNFFSVYFKLFSFINFGQLFILLFSPLLIPFWYLRNANRKVN